MHWVIQDNLFREDGLITLLECLQRFDIPHEVVKAVPLSIDAPHHEQLYPNPTPTGLVMVCGSTLLASIAKKRDWYPGSFLNENHDYRVWKEHYAAHLLNAGAVVSRIADIQPRHTPFFIRPVLDTKTFTGKVVNSWEEFEEWLEKGEPYSPSFSVDTIVACSEVKEIYTETRFFVVDGQIVGKSLYMRGNQKYPFFKEFPVDPSATEFAQQMIDIWQPARAFVIDVALTSEGYKIVECNCINSAGFYGIDVVNFVMAIENMEFDLG
jgi:hypothetical protein